MKVLTFEINDLLPKLPLHHINDRHYPSDSSWIITNPKPNPQATLKQNPPQKRKVISKAFCLTKGSQVSLQKRVYFIRPLTPNLQKPATCYN